MNYSYPILKGENITREGLELPLSIKMAKVLANHPFCLQDSLSYRKKNSSEIILATLDIEVYQKRLNGIKALEDIAIICHKSNIDFPEVYALREDFKPGLPHTFARYEEHPVCLCINELNFCEIRHKFNPFEFIEDIRRWFSLTSVGQLHNEDQPLEAFFIPSGYVVLPNTKDKTSDRNFYIVPYEKTSNIYKLTNTSAEGCPYTGFRILADPQVHGFVRKMPATIGEVSDFVTEKGISFATLILNHLELIKYSHQENVDLIQKKIAVLVLIPVKRSIKDKPELSESFFIFIDKTIEELITELEAWEKKGLSKPKFIKEIPINILSGMFDFNKIGAALYNNIKLCNDKFVLIGAGALGSQVLSLFARLGYGNWTILDFDRLYPHNLARHALLRENFGCNKAIELAEHVNNLLDEQFALAIDTNFVKSYNDEYIVNVLKQSIAIIDISTSISVARVLSRDYKDSIKAKRISCFLNPSGMDLVVLAEDKNRKYKLDRLEMQYYRFIYRNKELHNHLYFSSNTKVRYVRNSCREITSKINQTDIALHASICSKVIKECNENGKAIISIWSINQTTFEVQRYSIQPSRWSKYVIDDWKLYIDNWLIEQIQTQRLNKLPFETGGILIGSIDYDRKIIYLIDSIFSPKDSIEDETSFIRGIDNLSQSFEEYLKITDNQIQYLGEWHSHPKHCTARPSKYDKELFLSLMRIMSKQGYPFVMGIFAEDKISFKINCE